MKKISDLIKRNRVVEESQILEMAQINNKDNSNSTFNPDSYQVDVKNKEGKYRPPHIHILSHKDGWEIKVYIANGNLYQVKKYGNRKKTDNFSDIIHLAKMWMPINSTAFGLTEKKNYEVALIQWRVLNPDNEQECVFDY